MFDVKVQTTSNLKLRTSNFLARAERFELPSTVLETAILPLNYARKKAKSYSGMLEQLLEICVKDKNLLQDLASSRKLIAYFKISVTCPAPTVRPPSRIANFKPFSIAMGWINFTVNAVLSPGITISVPAGNSTSPVTSVVRK